MNIFLLKALRTLEHTAACLWWPDTVRCRACSAAVGLGKLRVGSVVCRVLLLSHSVYEM